jgi:glutamate formiminotransferase / 5-formyltetrahydrofolate cyclo-ligase
MFECVLNISEGIDHSILAELSRAAGASLRDRHSDVDHNRSVFTLINDAEPLVRDVHALSSRALSLIDLSHHVGAHPRFGVVDVVPFVSLDGDLGRVHDLRDQMGHWLAATHQVPVFFYGTVRGVERPLPEVRRRAFIDLAPDLGPEIATLASGASAVGARKILVAWNLTVSGLTPHEARSVAARLRRPALRALAFELASGIQLSFNLIDLDQVRPSQVYDAVLAALPSTGRIESAELVGLAPRALLDAEKPRRWAELGLSLESTIESRLGA